MPSTATARRFRVACTEHTVEAASYDAAFRRMLAVESLGACRAEHAIESLVDGEWLPAHVAMARVILAARVGATVDTFDGPLTKNGGSWSLEATERADAAGEAGTPEWYAALGGHEEATLTSDGRGAVVTGWCDCGAVEQARYERWSARGREAHGFVCRSCRRLTQTG